jgi:Cft2 family RNA processing exonuclease
VQFAQISYMDHLSVLVMLDGLVNFVRSILIIVYLIHPSLDLVMILEQQIAPMEIQPMNVPVLLDSPAITVQKTSTNAILILVRIA